MMMRLFILSLVLLTGNLFASTEGVLTLNSNLMYKKGKKEFQVSSGAYKTTFKTNASKLYLKFRDNTGKKHKIKMLIPKNSLPSRNGSFTYDSVQIEQPFHVQGQLQSREERSPTQSRMEGCTYQRPMRICQVDQYGRQICRIVYENVQGYRQVMFHYLLLHKTTRLAIQSTDYQELAVFNGLETTRQTVTEYIGNCGL